MQKKILVVLAVALAAVSATFWIHLRRSHAIEQERLRALETEAVVRREREQQVKQLEKEQARLDQQNQELATLAQSLRAKESTQSSNLSEIARKLAGTTTNTAGNAFPGEGGENAIAGMMEKMMKDPAMREMMRSQQKAMLGQMYGPLFKELGLSTDQRQRFNDLLIEGMMKGMDQAGTLFNQDPDKKAEAAKAVAEQKKNLDTEIKSLLGDEKFAQYEEYQKTVGERVQLNQFKQQLDGTDSALKENQMSQLLQILKEEKARVPSVIPDDPGRSLEAMEVLRSEEAMNKHFQWQEDLQKRVLERAGQTLSPEQLKEYSGFLDKQLNMQKLGMQMARQMFGGKGPAAGAK